MNMSNTKPPTRNSGLTIGIGFIALVFVFVISGVLVRLQLARQRARNEGRARPRIRDVFLRPSSGGGGGGGYAGQAQDRDGDWILTLLGIAGRPSWVEGGAALLERRRREREVKSGRVIPKKAPEMWEAELESGVDMEMDGRLEDELDLEKGSLDEKERSPLVEVDVDDFSTWKPMAVSFSRSQPSLPLSSSKTIPHRPSKFFKELHLPSSLFSSSPHSPSFTVPVQATMLIAMPEDPVIVSQRLEKVEQKRQALKSKSYDDIYDYDDEEEEGDIPEVCFGITTMEATMSAPSTPRTVLKKTLAKTRQADRQESSTSTSSPWAGETVSEKKSSKTGAEVKHVEDIEDVDRSRGGS